MSSSDFRQHRVVELLTAINRSLLITDERKGQLRKAIPFLTEEVMADLERMLGSERDIVNNLLVRAIGSAVERHDDAFLESLDAFLRSAKRKLQHCHERAEQEDEQLNQHSPFFDAA